MKTPLNTHPENHTRVVMRNDELRPNITEDEAAYDPAAT